jgi:hypothetical protein
MARMNNDESQQWENQLLKRFIEIFKAPYIPTGNENMVLAMGHLGN